jgi:photosystem II stability/assembly factor-like uncharacterized protein
MGLVTPREGWVANGLSLFFTRDGGTDWQLLHPPGIGGDLANSLTSFASVGTQDMWFGAIAGRGFGTCQHPTVPARSGLVFVYGSVDRTTDGGRSWSEVRLPDCGVAGSLSFANADDGYALGPASTATLAPAQGRLYRTVDGGRSWQVVGPVPFGGALVAPRSGSSIAFPSPGNGFAVSSYARSAGSLYRTSDGGRQWQEVALPMPPGYSAAALFGTPQFFSAQVGLVPALVKQAGTGAKALVVFTTDDGGRHWATARAPSDRALALYPAQGTVPFSAATASSWAAYPGPRLYATGNGGATWTATAPGPVAPAGSVQALQLVSPRDGWAIVSSVLEVTTDPGKTWHRVGS